jgi:hypothetical protein
MKSTFDIRRSRWTFLKSGWLWIAVVLVAGLTAVTVAISLYNRAMLEKDVDHLYQTVLADGDLAAAYDHADPRFRAAVAWPDFQAVAANHPHWFDRSQLRGVEVLWRTHQGGLYVVMRTRAGGEAVDFYCRPGERGDWKLVGIGPGLSGAVPPNVLVR